MTVTIEGSQDIMSFDTSTKCSSQLKLNEIQDILKAHDGLCKDRWDRAIGIYISIELVHVYFCKILQNATKRFELQISLKT